MGKIKTVIFDLDGTMYDYVLCNRAGLDALEAYCGEQFGLEHRGFDEAFRLADDNLQQRIGYSCASVHNRLIRFQCMLELLEKPLFPHALTMYHCYWDTFLAAMRPYEGLKECLRHLNQRGLTTAVGTNMTAYVQYQKLEQLEVTEFIRWMVTSEEAGTEKPDPGFYRLCIEKSKNRPEECLFIGDHPQCDVAGPEQAGMQALLFRPLKAGTIPDGGNHRQITSFTELTGKTEGEYQDKELF